MKKILARLCCASVLLAACNNQQGSTQAADSSTVKTDTVVKADSASKIIAANPLEPTASELKDDSVFADGSQPTSWANAGFTNPAAFKKFLKQLQVWVADNNKDSVASVMAYPLRNPEIKDKAAFLEKYDTYINDKVKTALKNQNLSQVFRQSQGAMIGDGKLWLSETKEGYRITAINN